MGWTQSRSQVAMSSQWANATLIETASSDTSRLSTRTHRVRLRMEWILHLSTTKSRYRGRGPERRRARTDQVLTLRLRAVSARGEVLRRVRASCG